MTAPRSRKEVKTYDKHLSTTKQKRDKCDFCAIDKNSEQLIKETPAFKLIRNIFPYSVWDSQTVTDHLMIVPKLHTDTLSALPPTAAQEFVQILASYESDGYSVWARAPGSTMKSQIHQHTHLIKLDHRIIKGLLFLRKPYFRIVIK